MNNKIKQHRKRVINKSLLKYLKCYISRKFFLNADEQINKSTNKINTTVNFFQDKFQERNLTENKLVINYGILCLISVSAEC